MPRSPLLLGACVAIHLAATDRLEQIARATGIPFTLAQQAAAEVGNLRSLQPATDDRKARRVCADLHLPEPSRTLGILHSYANAAR